MSSSRWRFYCQDEVGPWLFSDWINTQFCRKQFNQTLGIMVTVLVCIYEYQTLTREHHPILWRNECTEAFLDWSSNLFYFVTMKVTTCSFRSAQMHALKGECRDIFLGQRFRWLQTNHLKKKKRNVTNSVSASGRIAGYANSEKW